MYLVYISVEKGVTVKIPMIYFNCTPKKDSVTLNFSRTPFFFSIWNMFNLVGCNNNEASMNKDIVSCFSICKNMKNNISLRENNMNSIGNQGG